MTNLADIECDIVDGYARTVNTNVNKVDFPNHSWNVVKLSDKWYFDDATQASGFYNLDENEFVKDYNEGYFLATPELFLKNHFPLNGRWLLFEETPTLQNFVTAPIIYGKTYKHHITPFLPNKLVSNIIIGDSVVFQFKILDDTILKDISLVLNKGFSNKKIKPSTVKFKDGILELKYQFTKKGYYDVHAKVKGDYVVSYTVKVDKILKQKT